MQTNLNSNELAGSSIKVKKTWKNPTIEVIGQNSVQSGFVAGGLEGQLTKSWSFSTFNDKYHS